MWSNPMNDEPAGPGPRPPLSEAAQRALAEAEARRREIDGMTAFAPKEEGGRGGLEPVRYGDWEIKGLTSDF
jgi:hypothetical protein